MRNPGTNNGPLDEQVRQQSTSKCGAGLGIGAEEARQVLTLGLVGASGLTPMPAPVRAGAGMSGSQARRLAVWVEAKAWM